MKVQRLLSQDQKVDDPALARVSERHHPFMGSASRQRPIRRAVRVKTVQRLPRPMSEEQIAQLRGSLLHIPAGKTKRERIMPLNEEAAFSGPCRPRALKWAW
jgi:hypothetical protein